MKLMIDIFVELGQRLNRSVEEGYMSALFEQAVAQNEWFTQQSIASSIRAICSQMLSCESLDEWFASYVALPVAQPRDVAIVMAGNIPLVGLFDLLCVLMAGHRAWLKPSSKDSVLMLYVVEQLRDIEPAIPIYIYNDERSYDAVIATGGDNALRYFESRFKGCRLLGRANRHSVAVLAGDESLDELDALSGDIYTHSGLGCRNVSMLFVPVGYMPDIKGGEVAQGYKNNYRQSRAVRTLAGGEMVDNGISLFVKSHSLPASLSTISVYEYSSLEEVSQWISQNDEQLQCIVSRCVEHPRRVDFGEAQNPSLSDYPDGVDVMEFLTF